MAKDPSKPASGSGATRIATPTQDFTHEHVEHLSTTPQSGPKRGGDNPKEGAPVKK